MNTMSRWDFVAGGFNFSATAVVTAAVAAMSVEYFSGRVALKKIKMSGKRYFPMLMAAADFRFSEILKIVSSPAIDSFAPSQGFLRDMIFFPIPGGEFICLRQGGIDMNGA